MKIRLQRLLKKTRKSETKEDVSGQQKIIAVSDNLQIKLYTSFVSPMGATYLQETKKKEFRIGRKKRKIKVEHYYILNKQKKQLVKGSKILSE